MTRDYKASYKTITDDHLTSGLELSFIEGDRKRTLVCAKVSWLIDNVNKGLRYGGSPGQEAARYNR